MTEAVCWQASLPHGGAHEAPPLVAFFLFWSRMRLACVIVLPVLLYLPALLSGVFLGFPERSDRGDGSSPSPFWAPTSGRAAVPSFPCPADRMSRVMQHWAGHASLALTCHVSTPRDILDSKSIFSAVNTGNGSGNSVALKVYPQRFATLAADRVFFPSPWSPPRSVLFPSRESARQQQPRTRATAWSRNILVHGPLTRNVIGPAYARSGSWTERQPCLRGGAPLTAVTTVQVASALPHRGTM